MNDLHKVTWESVAEGTLGSGNMYISGWGYDPRLRSHTDHFILSVFLIK